MSHRDREIEIKLSVPSAAAARRVLRKAGFRVLNRRIFEDNIVFDTPESSLRGQRCLLRLRTAGKRTTLTFKGPPDVSRHKSREELETAIENGPGMSRILERLRFGRHFRYQKFRTEYSQPGEPGIAMLDETPIGVFLELEGPPGWIDSEALTLGFQESDYITASYGSLYLEWCRRRRCKPSDMVFRPRRPKT
jgi:adenylate cyclase class 2